MIVVDEIDWTEHETPAIETVTPPIDVLKIKQEKQKIFLLK